MVGEFSFALVSALERRLERHRFRFATAVQGRKHALAELNPFSATDTVEHLVGESTPPSPRHSSHHLPNMQSGSMSSLDAFVTSRNVRSK